MCAMNERRFWDPSQPQTLQIATFLLYFNAALGFLFGGFFSVFGFAVLAGMAGGAYGMANDKRWGYYLSVTVAFIGLAFILSNGLNAAVRYDTISLMFAVALVALLLHPQSRDYQRIWFK